MDNLLQFWREGTATNAAQIANLNQLVGMANMQHTIRRGEAQVDAVLRCEKFEPPDDDDVKIWFNPLIVGDRAIKTLQEDDDAAPVPHHHRPHRILGAVLIASSLVLGAALICAAILLSQSSPVLVWEFMD